MKKDNRLHKLMEERNKHKVTCKCGHQTAIASNIKKVICDNCGHWVYKRKSDEFKEKLVKELRKCI